MMAIERVPVTQCTAATGSGKDSLKSPLVDNLPNYVGLASILPQFKKCKSFTHWGLDLNKLSTVPELRVGISRHANFFHENLAKLLVICAAQIAVNLR